MRHYWEPKLPRNRVWLTLCAAALCRLGHTVRVIHKNRCPHWVDRYLPANEQLTNHDVDLYVSTESTWMRTPETPMSHMDKGRRIAVIGCCLKTDIAKQHTHAIHAMISHGIAMSANVIQTVWPPFIGIIDLLRKESLIDSYLSNDLESIRSVFVPPPISQVRGWYGGERSAYGRESKTVQLGNKVEVRWSTAARSVPSVQWLSWSLACRAGLDLPGVTWRTSRFTTFVLFGIPVVCCPSDTFRVSEPFANTEPSILRSNVIWLDNWGDTDSLDSGLENTESIVAEADKAYREGWSPQGQMKLLIKRAMA